MARELVYALAVTSRRRSSCSDNATLKRSRRRHFEAREQQGRDHKGALEYEHRGQYIVCNVHILWWRNNKPGDEGVEAAIDGVPPGYIAVCYSAST